MLFISLEDETGIANLILTEDFVERNRVVVVSEPYLLAQGVLQNLDGAISIKVSRIEPLRFPSKPAGSHDFH
jgi:error-prone DNA polymerase